MASTLAVDDRNKAFSLLFTIIMAPAMATARLRKELVKLQKEPAPDTIAEPDESNILKWHYCIRGPTSTAFEGGTYLGKLVFPPEYPMKGPSIYMMTPSGRFQINTRLCMSMSNFHPESWNPMWSVSSIIQGIQSFMASDELTTGGLQSPEPERKKLASLSMKYNNKMFPNLFEGDIEAAFAAADKARIEAEATSAKTDGSRSRRSRTRAASTKTGEKKSAEEADSQSQQEEKDESKEEAKSDLTPEEIEKRRNRNAKKRAKQKAKKAVQQQEVEGAK
jgi:ubiquitin-conjugating enzyme E2 J2